MVRTRIVREREGAGISKIALITGTTGFGDQGRKPLKKYAEKMGITIVADETYGPGDTDMTPQLTKIKNTDAQAPVNWSIVPGQSTVLKNMRQLGMTIAAYQSHGFGNISYVKLAGEAAAGTLFPEERVLVAETLPDDNRQKKMPVEYKQAYEQKFNEPISTFGGYAYDALWLVIQALGEGGAGPGEDPRLYREQKGLCRHRGVFDFSPEDHSGLTKDAFEMLTVKNGKFALAEKFFRSPLVGGQGETSPTMTE